MAALRAGLCLAIAASIGLEAAQVPSAIAPSKPDTPPITAMIDQVRTTAGPRWAYAVHFWCEEPHAKGGRNPFVVGTAEYQKFVGVMDGCTRVNLARRGVT